MRVDNLRNIAIIAHVDHGKTTMVDKLLRATDAFRANQQVEDRVLDSNDQERERGITILAKNISIEYKDVKINVIDTPGHADFGGEVERVLRMADGALLLVDAFEGPMPQTRFVLRHAIDTGLKIMIVINKIDRPGANPEKAYNDCLDLMADLGATDDQLEFAMEHVVYASAMNGFARLDPNDGNMDMYPLLDMIIDDMPAPEVDENAPLAMQCVTIDHSNFVGRIGIGRVYSGTIHQGDQILVVKNDGSSATATVKQLFTFDYLGRTECQEVGAGDIAAVVGIERTDIGDVYTDPENPVELEPIEIDPPTLSIVFEASTSPLVGRIGIGRVYSGTIHQGDQILVVKNDRSSATATVKQLFTFDYLGRTECQEVGAGDIAAVVGIDRTDIGDVYTDPENPVELEPIEIDPPTLSIVFEASTSPLVGRDGDIVGARQLKERLFNEAENNVTMKIEELEDKSGVEVSGRGILHLSVLMESMRREGFEFQVGRPRVLFKKDENGNKMEPVEQAVVECPDEYSGKVVEVFGTSGGIMTSMDTSGIVTHLEFKIPTRGIMGLKNRIMNVTHGEGVFYHTFLEYGPYAGEIGNRQNGAMISMTTEKAVAYALGTLQERGQLFVEPGTECYEGMIVGERSKAGDMVVNIARTKNLGNQRSSTSDISVQLVPPRTFSLEEALEYIADDELVEITPKNIRLRKRLLNATDRKKAAVRAGQVNK